MYIDKTFKNVVIFTYRSIARIVRDREICNISNTSEALLNLIDDFEIQFKDNKLVMYCDDEIELNNCDVIFYNYKTKSFIIESDETYFKLKEINDKFRKIDEIN